MHPMCTRVHINVWRKLVHPVQRWHLLSWRREHLHPMCCRELLSHLRRILLHPLRSRQRILVQRELVCPVQRRDVLGWRHAVHAVQRRVLLPASRRQRLHPVPRHSRICCRDQRGGGVHLPCGLAAVLRLRVRVQRRIPPSEQRDRPGAVQLRHLRLQQDCKFFTFNVLASLTPHVKNASKKNPHLSCIYVDTQRPPAHDTRETVKRSIPVAREPCAVFDAPRARSPFRHCISPPVGDLHRPPHGCQL